MKRFHILLVVLALTALAVLGPPFFSKAKVRGGPGIYSELLTIQHMKDEWLAEGGTNEWPTAKDLFQWSSDKSINEVMWHRYGALYFINRTNAPPFAYIPKASGPYRGGEVLVLSSNGLGVVHQ